MTEDRNSEDPFADLDELFAPINELDEEEEPAPAGPPEGRHEAPEEPQKGQEPQEPEGSFDLPDLQIDLPGDEDLAAIGEAPPAGEAEAEPWEALPEAGPTEEAADQEFLFGGDTQGAPPQEPGAGPIAPETTEAEPDFGGFELEPDLGAGPPEPEAQEPAVPPPAEGPISVDDLRAAPPQYAGLPGGGEEEPILEEESAAFTAADEAMLPTEESALGPPDELDATLAQGAEPPAPTRRRFFGRGRTPAAAAPEAPEASSVEEAAERFAEGVRETPEEVERELLSGMEGPARRPRTVRIEPDSMEQGPSFRDAMVHGEDEEPTAAPSRRNVTAALVSGGILGVAVIVTLAIGKAAFTVLATAIVLLGQGELYAVMKRRGAQPAIALGLVVGALILAGAYLKGELGSLAMLAFGMMLSVLWYMAGPPRARRGTAVNVGATLLGLVYVPFLASYALLLLRVPSSTGTALMLAVVGMTILYDVCAYAIGSLWGNRPLAPTISPRKSVEGAVGATFVLILVSLAILPSIGVLPLGAARAVGLALVISATAPLGDLAESALKRDLGVKDMGSILPGHGGILDRIDAILFAAPAAYYYLQLAYGAAR